MRPLPGWVYALYYPWSGFLNRLWPWIRVEGMRLRVAPGVYKPIQNEGRVAALVPPGGDVLDVGCGSGVLALAVATASRSVLALDVCPVAVRCARENAARLGLANVEVRQRDAFAEPPGRRFGAVLCGPPFGEVEVTRPERWASAPGFLEALFAHAPGWLEPDGTLVVHYLADAEARLEGLGRRHGLALREVRPNHAKGPGLRLLGWLYLQPGLRTAFYRFAPARGAPASEDP